MIRRCLLLVIALLASACTDVYQTSESTDPTPEESGSTTAVADPDPIVTADGIEVPAPNPDPTPIEPSDDVRIGTLDNGLTYYVRSNQAPGSSLSLRLAVNAGSLQQEEPESGGAHFLEHMLFNGTENFPGNELARALERIGVQFGADLNAYTSFDETVYQLDLTSITDETIGIGFDVLADWAWAATIEQDATVAERGVVREEIRLRDEGADAVVSEAFNSAYLDGTVYEGREPGGRADLILETDAEQLRAFYERWYRPDLMAVIAVGDLPVDRLEEEILQRFDAFVVRSDGTERPEVTVAPIDEPITEIVADPELARTFGSIDFSLTTWDRTTIGGERLTLMQDLFSLMISNRLQDAADRGDVELDQPFATRFDQTRSQSFLGFNFEAPDLAVGTEYILTELRRLELSGFTDAEFDRARSEVSTGLDQLLSTARTTQDRSYADAYVANFLGTAEASSVEDTHERLSGALDQMTASDVTDLYRWEMSRAAPIVIMVGADEAELPTVAQLDEAVEAAANAVDDGEERSEELVIEALMEAPEPVDPVQENTIPELAGREWVFGNGITVRFVPSEIAANQVNLFAIAEGGWSLLEPDDGALAPYAVQAVAESGLGDFDRVSLRRFLAGSTTGLAPFIEETSEGFVGGAGVEDMEILFQRLHLAITDPAIDELALSETIDDADDRRRFADTDAGFATLNALADVRFESDPRFVLTPPDLDDLTARRALDIYRQRLGTVDDLIVVVVGDTDEADVAALAARYLGTLPTGSVGEPDTWLDVRPDGLSGLVRRDVVAGSGDATGTVALLYPSEIEIDAETRIGLLVLEQIFGARLLDVVREELGASYGGQAVIDARVAPTEGVDVLLFANIDPDRGEEILDVIDAQAVDLAFNGPTAEEFARARSVLQGDFDLVGNGDFIEMLLTRPGEQVLTFQRRSRLLAALEPADVTALAALVLPRQTRAEIVTVPG